MVTVVLAVIIALGIINTKTSSHLSSMQQTVSNLTHVVQSLSAAVLHSDDEELCHLQLSVDQNKNQLISGIETAVGSGVCEEDHCRTQMFLGKHRPQRHSRRHVLSSGLGTFGVQLLFLQLVCPVMGRIQRLVQGTGSSPGHTQHGGGVGLCGQAHSWSVILGRFEYWQNGELGVVQPDAIRDGAQALEARSA
ncbi:uncharacterized protein LOC117505339 isoform X2 [Thalassophryne amazonica]|uniref:uncharacterized protein LOC117505339 isoform X2 n=1 Tax=Thalassophryne amazonica TaxID=390379 RepID=UPI001471372F|nr:uncharacterized protein LOC117505339 isoform X2 [Thalassophryne amazonica]